MRRVPTVNCGSCTSSPPYGRELEPIVLALGRWGFGRWASRASDVVTGDSLTIALRTAFRPDAAAALPPTDYELHVGDVSVAAVVADGELDVVPIGADALPQPRRPAPEAAFESGLELVIDPEGFRDLISGRLDAEVDAGAIPILAGDLDAVVRFTHTFRIEPAVPPTDASAGAAAEASVA